MPFIKLTSSHRGEDLFVNPTNITFVFRDANEGVTVIDMVGHRPGDGAHVTETPEEIIALVGGGATIEHDRLRQLNRAADGLLRRFDVQYDVTVNAPEVMALRAALAS